MSMDALEPKLEKILRRNLLYADPNAPLPHDVELVELGLDSMSAINLLVDIEDSLGIVIPDAMLTAENFKTFQSLLDMVDSVFAAGGV